MRIGVSMYSYQQSVQQGKLDIPGFIEEAKRAGADGVELLTYYYQDVERDRERALEALATHGLVCPIFSVSQNFAKPDAGDREVELGKIRFGVDEAKHYGAEIVRVFAGDVSPSVTFDQARTWIIEGLVEASRYAASRGVKLALENHGTLAGRGDQVKAIIEDVRFISGLDVLGANPDTGNFVLVNQPSHEAIEEVAALANMVHFKDFKLAKEGDPGHVYRALDGRGYVGTAVGEGEVELKLCIEALRESGFDGWLSVEYEGAEDPMTAVPRSIQNARRYI